VQAAREAERIAAREALMSEIAPHDQSTADNDPHDAGPWTVSDDGRRIQSDDFTHDIDLHVTGDFYDNAQRKAYSDNLAAKLNAGVAALTPRSTPPLPTTKENP
jgi:hypothetical protein